HDSAAVSVALVCTTLIGILLSFVLGRRVALGSRELTTALRDLAGPDQPPAGTAPQPTPPRPSPQRPSLQRSSAPGEIATLAAELDQTRERLSSAQRQAETLEDSRRELVAFMSHDLRTPLAGLRALAEGLEDGVIDDHPAALRQVRLTVERMNGLVTDLFEVSRLRAGPAPETATRSMVSLVELSHDVVGELSAHAAGRGVTLRLHTPDDDRLAVLGNADELARALTNLVGNAVRHTAAGSEVLLDAARRPDGRIALGVTDGCGGIAEADLQRVFDLGWRADPGRTTTDAGAGLGLAIAKGVAEAHHGTIGVANVPGGCRFALVLPGETAPA
ncbi:MAG: HAMP domain-containing histidine kinase, partial [Actinomycetota bacterium]|nr:HAMP domain-containing histidine kinase [Actinomycetota bacterium]